MMARVVILGAGIAGHTAALHLRRWLDRAHEVVVVSPNPDWNWIPSNIWVGVGRMDASKVLIPLKPIYRRKGIIFHQGRATAIHPEGMGEQPTPSVDFVYSEKVREGETANLTYDYLINATGPQLNFAATPGLGPAGHSYSVCTAEHATESAKALPLGDSTVGQVVEGLAITIGEKIELGNVAYFDGPVAVYLHKRAADLPPAVGVIVEYEGDEAAARGAAMQVAALKAQYLTRDEVPADIVAAEKDVLTKKTIEEGKPEAAVAKIVEGRLGGFFKELVLLEQESVSESKKTVKAVLDAAGTTVKRFARFEVGA